MNDDSTYDEGHGPRGPHHPEHDTWSDPTGDAVLASEWHLATANRQEAYR